MRSLFTAGVVFILIFPWQTSSFANCVRIEEQDVSRSTAALPRCPGQSFSEFSSSNFKIVHDADETEAAEIAQLLEQTYQRFQSRFQNQGFELRKPEHKLMWICFNDCDRFNSYALEADGMDLSWLSGYYSAKTNVVAIIKPHTRAYIRERQGGREADGSILAITSVSGEQPDDVKIMHEAAHQFAFNTGLQKRRVMYPLWLSEGLATSFEAGGTGSNDVRMQRLVEMYRQDRLIPLKEFVAITRLPADVRTQKDIYAEAYGLFNFLFEQRSGELKHYLSELYKLEPGWRSKQKLRSEFFSSFGSIGELEDSWRQFVSSLSDTEP